LRLRDPANVAAEKRRPEKDQQELG
jgi:hypothetical protein